MVNIQILDHCYLAVFSFESSHSFKVQICVHRIADFDTEATTVSSLDHNPAPATVVLKN